MSEFRTLLDAVECLKTSIFNFPVGAISLDDFKPIEEKIKAKRETLKRLNAKLLTLKAHHSYRMFINLLSLKRNLQ